MDIATLREQYQRDGVIFLPGFLNEAALADAKAAYDWSLANPGPRAGRMAQEDKDAVFYQDLYNPGCQEAYKPMLLASPLGEFLAELWGTPEVWFMYEQVFLKEGGESRRTPWHQDASYLAVGGEDLAVAWITFDEIAKDDSLEFIPGSHKGPLYNGSRFELGDDTAPLHPGASLPRLPDIEAQRDQHQIVSWAVKPGDVVLFHTHTLHGGAPTHKGGRRRTLTLRFFGRNAHYERREGGAGPAVAGFHSQMKTGDAFRHPSFLQLHPRGQQKAA